MAKKDWTSGQIRFSCFLKVRSYCFVNNIQHYFWDKWEMRFNFRYVFLDGSIGTWVLWGLLETLNLGMIVLLINSCIIFHLQFFLFSQNGVYCAEKFIVIDLISFI